MWSAECKLKVRADAKCLLVRSATWMMNYTRAIAKQDVLDPDCSHANLVFMMRDRVRMVCDNKD